MSFEHNEKFINEENYRRRVQFYRTFGDVTHLVTVQSEARLKYIEGRVMHVKRERKDSHAVFEDTFEPVYHSTLQVVINNEVVFEADGLARSREVTAFIKGYALAKETAMVWRC